MAFLLVGSRSITSSVGSLIEGRRDAWPGQTINIAVDINITTSTDQEYLSLLEPQGRTYMAPVSVTPLHV